MAIIHRAFATAVLFAALGGASSAAAQCSSAADCRAGRVCKEGQCVQASCAKDIDCPNGGICVASECSAALAVPPPAPQGVTSPLTLSLAPSPAYRTESRGIAGLYIAGPIVFGAMWLTTIGLTAGLTASDDPNRGRNIGTAVIPIVGPFVGLTYEGSGPWAGALVASGVVQTAGLAMTIVGLAVRRDVKVPVLIGDRFSIVPTAGGLAAVGAF